MGHVRASRTLPRKPRENLLDFGFDLAPTNERFSEIKKRVIGKDMRMTRIIIAYIVKVHLQSDYVF